jgi:hypothetical protein
MADVERITELWRAAADALELPGVAEDARAKTVAQIVGDAHQVILNAPRPKDAADKEAMRLLEIAYARLEGVR